MSIRWSRNAVCQMLRACNVTSSWQWCPNLLTSVSVINGGWSIGFRVRLIWGYVFGFVSFWWLGILIDLFVLMVQNLRDSDVWIWRFRWMWLIVDDWLVLGCVWFEDTFLIRNNTFFLFESLKFELIMIYKLDDFSECN